LSYTLTKILDFLP